ncbi:MAG: GGDEF domain-containing protein [Actinobacteria bacterium]|nr:GGDEF domain-containing protein [Actinomycetota bacterium]
MTRIASRRGALARRSGDPEALPATLRRVSAWLRTHWSPVTSGQALLVVAGLLTSATSPLLRLTADDRLATVLAAGGLLALAVLSFLVPWTRLPRATTLGFPLIVWTSLAVVGLTTHGLTSVYTGLYALCFAYLGLHHRPGLGAAFAPFVIACYVAAFGGWSAQLLPRLLIAITVWLLLAELLSAMLRRQRALTEELRRAAHIDPLTAVPNRRDLDLRLTSTRVGDTIVVCDLDDFKQLNDRLGHAEGDRVLADFGRLLRTCLRGEDYAARFGGEEFVLVLTGTEVGAAERLLARLAQRWSLLRPDVTFSAGAATCRADRTTAETLVAADDCLYQAKAAGRDRAVCEPVDVSMIGAGLRY